MNLLRLAVSGAKGRKPRVGVDLHGGPTPKVLRRLRIGPSSSAQPMAWSPGICKLRASISLYCLSHQGQSRAFAQATHIASSAAFITSDLSGMSPFFRGLGLSVNSRQFRRKLSRIACPASADHCSLLDKSIKLNRSWCAARPRWWSLR